MHSGLKRFLSMVISRPFTRESVSSLMHFPDDFMKVEMNDLEFNTAMSTHGFERIFPFDHNFCTIQHQQKLDKLSKTPVVTVMGHVDHGKTTLLDYLRKSSLVDAEAGGITQHIGAFQGKLFCDIVALCSGHTQSNVTFIDTPGHAAFSDMRSRGTFVTDVGILVVSADDGVMPQTEECIENARRYNVPLVIAVTKCDKYMENFSAVTLSLGKFGLYTEDHGGDVIAVPISGLTGLNVDRLVSSVSALAEVLELYSYKNVPVSCIAIEAKTQPGLGIVSTVIVSHGILRIGSILVSGNTFCKVRSMRASPSMKVTEAYPGEAVEISGWKSLPDIGVRIFECESEAIAAKLVDAHVRIMESRGLSEPQAFSTQSCPVVNIILKCDTIGSIEAIQHVIEVELKSTKAKINIVKAAVGDLTEVDINTALMSSSRILLFNSSCPKGLHTLMRKSNVEIFVYNNIYRVADYLREILIRQIPAEINETMVAEAAILKVFPGASIVPVAGCRILTGTFRKENDENVYIQVLRKGSLLHEGKISSLKHMTKDVPSVQAGIECGITFENYTSFKVGDTVRSVRKTIIPPML